MSTIGPANSATTNALSPVVTSHGVPSSGRHLTVRPRLVTRQSCKLKITEGEQIQDLPHLANIFREYRRFGFRTAIDDFGAGYAGLNLLSDHQPVIIKIDMNLVHGIDISKPKQAIVNGIVSIYAALNVRVPAEGIETAAERDFLRDAGIDLMQGYLFCRPALQAIDCRAVVMGLTDC